MNDLKHFIEEQLQLGTYRSSDEMIAEGLRLLREKHEQDKSLAGEFRAAIERADSGDPGVKVDSEEIKSIGRKFLAQLQADA
jgi:putative addiction module CopG family antidote